MVKWRASTRDRPYKLLESHVERTWVTVEGNEAVANIAHTLSEVIAIYPITPSTPMGEMADSYSAAGRTNLWGTVPLVMEMQSEGGAAGAIHGALQTGSLATASSLPMLPAAHRSTVVTCRRRRGPSIMKGVDRP